MAIGMSRMFGIFLPLNFNSPYKAHSIIEFWRRWHMTLSRFLRDYLYIPLGGNRRGARAALRQSDGHHAARRALARRGLDLRGLGRAARRSISASTMPGLILSRRSRRASHAWPSVAAFMLTFLSVVVAWVFFRAGTLSSAIYILSRMADPGHVAFGRAEMVQGAFVACYAALAFLAPNTQTIMGYDHKADRRRKPGAWPARPAFVYASRRGWRSEFRYPAIQRIHLF